VQTRSFRDAGHLPSLSASLIHFDISFMVWVLLGALGAYVASDLGLSPLQKGLMVAVFGVLAVVGALAALGVTTRLRVWLTPPGLEAAA